MTFNIVRWKPLHRDLTSTQSWILTWSRFDGFDRKLQKWKIHSDPPKHIVPEKLNDTQAPGGLNKSPIKFLVLPRPRFGWPSSHMDKSARQGFRLLLKDFVLFVVGPIVVWSQLTRKIPSHPPPPRLCLERYYKLLRRKSTNTSLVKIYEK